MESYELAKACAKVLSDKKASDIVILNVHRDGQIDDAGPLFGR